MLLLVSLLLVVNMLQVDVQVILSSETLVVYVNLGLWTLDQLLGVILSFLLVSKLVIGQDFLNVMSKVGEETLLYVFVNIFLSLIFVVLDCFFKDSLKVDVSKLTLFDLRV